MPGVYVVPGGCVCPLGPADGAGKATGITGIPTISGKADRLVTV